MSLTPQTNYVKLWRQRYFKKHGKYKSFVEKVGGSQIIGNRKCDLFFSKRRVPKNPEDPSDSFSKNLNMGAISIEKHEMEFL